MEEYEYSFNVKSIEPYIEYCENNGYILEEKVKQNRIVYQNNYSDEIIARITTTIKEDISTCVFDCKYIGHKDKSLKISKESLPIIVTEENRKEIESILGVLNFYISANNDRTRYIYSKDEVKFEIDNYTSPIMCVIGIEGEREKVNKVYQELKIEE